MLDGSINSSLLQTKTSLLSTYRSYPLGPLQISPIWKGISFPIDVVHPYHPRVLPPPYNRLPLYLCQYPDLAHRVLSRQPTGGYFSSKFYKVHFRASILARLSYQKSLKKLDWRVISKKNLLVRLTGASMRAICCVMSSTFHLKALITDK